MPTINLLDVNNNIILTDSFSPDGGILSRRYEYQGNTYNFISKDKDIYTYKIDNTIKTDINQDISTAE